MTVKAMMTNDISYRNAAEKDSTAIAKTIAYSFERDFSSLYKDMERIALILESGVDTSRFVVAEQNGKIIGVTACADCNGRSVTIDKKQFRKHLGFVRGTIGFHILKDEFMLPVPYPKTTGYVEFVGVLKEARGKGIAKSLLKAIMENKPQYNEFILDVTDINTSAQKCYSDYGFVEFERKPQKYAKMTGYTAKIFMKYAKLK
jgi:ribosomal protein S18 acetylase RimI-like enzyme